MDLGIRPSCVGRLWPRGRIPLAPSGAACLPLAHAVAGGRQALAGARSVDCAGPSFRLSLGGPTDVAPDTGNLAAVEASSSIPPCNAAPLPDARCNRCGASVLDMRKVQLQRDVPDGGRSTCHRLRLAIENNYKLRADLSLWRKLASFRKGSHSGVGAKMVMGFHAFLIGRVSALVATAPAAPPQEPAELRDWDGRGVTCCTHIVRAVFRPAGVRSARDESASCRLLADLVRDGIPEAGAA